MLDGCAMATSLETLGKNIAARRGALEMTQAQFAAEMEVEQGTVSAWEKGRIDIPYSRLCKIAEKLKTSPAALSDPSVPVVDINKKRLDAISAIIGSDPIEFEALLHSLEPILQRGLKQTKRGATRL